MTPSFFFQNVHKPIKRAFKNNADFLNRLFVAAGSNYFERDSDYPYRVYKGSKPLSKHIKQSFPLGVRQDKLALFLHTHITETDLSQYKSQFGFPDSLALEKYAFCQALAAQFALFIQSPHDNSVADDNIQKNYLRFTEASRKQSSENSIRLHLPPSDTSFRYNVALYDDDKEKLNTLQQALIKLDHGEDRYSIYTYPITYASQMLEQSEFQYADVYVLDISRESNPNAQTGSFVDYTGKDLLETQKEILRKSQVYVYSRIPRENLRTFIDLPDVFIYSKETPEEELARAIKVYLDKLYLEDYISIRKLGNN